MQLILIRRSGLRESALLVAHLGRLRGLPGDSMNDPGTRVELGRVDDDGRARSIRCHGNRTGHAHGDADHVMAVPGVLVTGNHDERAGSAANRRQARTTVTPVDLCHELRGGRRGVGIGGAWRPPANWPRATVDSDHAYRKGVGLSSRQGSDD